MTRVALAAMAACTTAVLLYGVVRGIQLLVFSEPNPATVIWSAHAGYFWRTLIVGYAGGMAAIVAWIFAGRDPVRVARVLAWGVLVAGAIITAQGILLP